MSVAASGAAQAEAETTFDAASAGVRERERDDSGVELAPEESSPDMRLDRGEPTAFDFRALYDEHVGFVWRNLRRLGIGLDEVDDRTQEVFLIAFRKSRSFEERGFGAKAWLYQILLRVASDARRHRRRHPEDATAASEFERSGSGESTDPSALLERRRALETLDKALAAVEVNRRAVLVLCEIEEMSAPEVAKILELPVNTVYSRLRVARAELELALRGANVKERESDGEHATDPRSSASNRRSHDLDDPKGGSR